MPLLCDRLGFPAMAKRQSLPWWLNGHSNPRSSPWLQSVLLELDKKTKAILELIEEEEAESFLQSAERYAKKRPELIHMIEDFHLANKLLAQRYDRLKSEMKNHQNVDLTLPISSGCYLGKLTEHIHGAQPLGTYDSEESEVSDAREVMENDGVEDNEAMDEEVEWLKLDNQMLMHEEPQYCSPLCMYSSEESELCEAKEANDRVDDEEKAINKEIERLMMENKMLKAEAEARDEEKREVIRQLCLPISILKSDNCCLRKCVREKQKKWTFLWF